VANLSVEEPDALMRARPGLWEPWVGNDPWPPGPQAVTAANDCTEECTVARNGR